MMSRPLFQNTFTLRKPRVADIVGIIKVATMFIKTTFKDPQKVKKIRNNVSKCNLYQYFMR